MMSRSWLLVATPRSASSLSSLFGVIAGPPFLQSKYYIIPGQENEYHVSGRDYDLTTLEGRTDYLQSLGWEIDPESESFRTVIVPDQLEGIMAQYNKLQLKQGYDLNRHLGETCLQYCYEVTNYPDADGKVLVSLYLQDGEIIAADIHSTALNGFMHGLTKTEAE